ncbi:MAG: respiratory chain complex I subunit 1 family protein [Planctomycetota bacterium]
MSVPWIVGMMLLGFAGTAVLGLALKWVDRKVTARVQWRKGPPWFQPYADVAKLLGKETIIPENARRTGFLTAPIAGLAATILAAAILWSVNVRPVANGGFMGDLIVVFYLLTVPSLMIVLGGASSGNPHGAIGASREMKLILSYELPLALALLVAVIAGGWTLSLEEIATASGVPVLTKIALVLGFLVGLLCVQAKLGLVPFDQAEAETELMGGVYCEYSGPPLAMFYLTRAMLHAVLPALLVTVFWGAFARGVVSAIVWIVLYLVAVVLITLVRNTNPRVRIDHAMKFFWYGLTPIAVLAVVLALIGSAQ